MSNLQLHQCPVTSMPGSFSGMSVSVSGGGGPAWSWKHNEEALKGSGDVKYTPQRLEGPKTYGWQKVTPAWNMARIWYLCYYVQFLGCNLGLAYQVNWIFWNMFLPNGGFDVDILTFFAEAIQHENLKRVIVRLPLSADFNRMNCKPGKKRPTSLIFHGSWNLSFLSPRKLQHTRRAHPWQSPYPTMKGIPLWPVGKSLEVCSKGVLKQPQTFILGCNCPIPLGVSRVNSLFPPQPSLHQKFHLDLPKCPCS